MSQAAELIKRARQRSGISQRKLARRAGTTQAAISRIERGLEDPTVERLEQILAGLGWRPVIELEPIATHEGEPQRLYADRDGDPAVRLEGGLNWIEFARELVGAVNESGG